jgi:hypothetical protein
MTIPTENQERIEALQEQLQAIVEDAKRIVSAADEDGSANTYWVAQLENIIGGEGSNPYDITLQSTINGFEDAEMEALADEEEERDRIQRERAEETTKQRTNQ